MGLRQLLLTGFETEKSEILDAEEVAASASGDTATTESIRRAVELGLLRPSATGASRCRARACCRPASR